MFMSENLNSPSSAAEIIAHPILSQLENTRQALLKVDPAAQRVFLDFFLDPQVGRVMDNIDSTNIDNLPNPKHYKEVVTGVLFELFCYHFLKQQLKSNQFLLTPAALTEIFKKLHPAKAVMHHYGLSEGVKGLSHPDIVLIEDAGDRLNIVNSYECKMGIGDNGKQMTQDLFLKDLGNNLRLRESGGNERLGKILAEFGLPNKPVFLPREKLTYIIPEGIESKWLNFTTTPISNINFRDVAYSLITDIQSNI